MPTIYCDHPGLDRTDAGWSLPLAVRDGRHLSAVVLTAMHQDPDLGLAVPSVEAPMDGDLLALRRAAAPMVLETAP